MNPDILVTGCASGLGKFIHANLPSFGVSRQNASDISKITEADTIIHCAFSKNSKRENQELLNSLLKIKHRKFFLISSCDVYPEDDTLHAENEVFNKSIARSSYALEKMEMEEAVLSATSQPIVIRPVSLIGKNMKENNLTKLITFENPVLSLTSDSQWNFVLHEELLACINKLYKTSFEGIINFARTEPVSVGEIARVLNRNPQYGYFRYKVPFLTNNLAKDLLPELGESSLTFFKRWIATNS